MSIDGVFLRHLSYELKNNLIGSRIYKIYQPDKSHLILTLRNFHKNFKLLISISPNNSRVNITENSIENPYSPPMFCMLLRKHLELSKIIDVRQIGLERILYIDFESKNNLDEFIKLTLAIEIMGKYSNAILINSENVIIDAMKRIPKQDNLTRVIVPKLTYSPPPVQKNKYNLLNNTYSETVDEILDTKPDNNDEYLYKRINNILDGVSSKTALRIVNQMGLTRDSKLSDINSYNINLFKNIINEFMDTVKNISGKPIMLFDDNNQTIDFTFFDIVNHDKNNHEKLYSDFSKLLDDYYYQNDKSERIHSKTVNLVKNINNIISRRKLKIQKQESELAECREKEKYKIYGDLIISNLYKIKKGQEEINLINFYSENQENLTIKLLNNLTPVENANRYYKIYKKLNHAEKILQEQILSAKSDITYLEDALDFLSRAESDVDFYEIYEQIVEQGYIRPIKINKQIKLKPSKPLEYRSKDGFRILIGKNSKQNEKLTLKTASKDSIWLHTKNLPGAHTILVTDGKKPSDEAIKYAAYLCAINSKAKDSSNVEVDYTKVSNVKKIKGGKPGMVNYTDYKTIVVPLQNYKIKEL